MGTVLIAAGLVVLVIILANVVVSKLADYRNKKKAEQIIQLIMKTVNKVPPVRLMVAGKTVSEPEVGGSVERFTLAAYRSFDIGVEAMIRFDDYRDGLCRKLVDVAIESQEVRALVTRHFKGQDGYDVSIWADDSLRIFVPDPKV